MANVHRGEIEAELAGRTYTLCLTLGALAELEAKFMAGDIAGIAGRFEQGRFSARDLIVLIGCGLRGAGHQLSDDDVANLRHAEGLPGYARIAAALLQATFGSETEAGQAAMPPP